MQTYACIVKNINQSYWGEAYFLCLPSMHCCQCATARSILTVEKETENSLVVIAYFQCFNA